MTSTPNYKAYVLHQWWNRESTHHTKPAKSNVQIVFSLNLLLVFHYCLKMASSQDSVNDCTKKSPIIKTA